MKIEMGCCYPEQYCIKEYRWEIWKNHQTFQYTALYISQFLAKEIKMNPKYFFELHKTNFGVFLDRIF